MLVLGLRNLTSRQLHLHSSSITDGDNGEATDDNARPLIFFRHNSANMEPSSSVGSDIFVVSAVLVISLLVLLLLRHYLPLRSTPGYLLVPVFLALVLPCSIILLVPIDLASADGSSSRGIWLPERAVLVSWRVTYWLTFLLTWWLLPLLGEYCDSGYRETRGRVIYSLRSNARYQLILLGSGVAGLVYFILTNGFHVSSIKGLVMALAYAWGLILAVGLMGHGLVALPRRLWRNANVASRLRRLQMQAPKTKDSLDDAAEGLAQLENTITQLKTRKSGTSRDMQEWIDDLADSTAAFDPRPGVAASVQATNATIPAVVTERYLADLTRKLKRARHKKARFVNEWSNLCQQAQDTQTIQDAASSQKLEFGRSDDSLVGRMKFVTPAMRYQIYANIIPYLRIGLAAFLAVASAMVVWSEIVRSFAPKISVIGLTVVHHPNSESSRIGFTGQVIASFWLLYMCACALYAISDVKVWGNRALVKRQTYAESACWYSLQVAKLTVPLSFNFITMMPTQVYTSTQFYRFLGSLIDLTPLGSGFSMFFPCFLLVPVLATLFNLYGKVKGVIGFGFLEDESEDNPSGFGTGGWREGRALIEQELQSRGEGGSHVGLASRAADIESRPGTTAPASSRRQQQEIPAHVREANRQFNSITNEPEEDTGARHFYQDFGERVRNTFDTIERPEWTRNITVPKWMQGDEGGGGPGAGLSRWFGGRAEDGRVRL